MQPDRGPRWGRILAVAALVVLLVVAGYGIYLAGVAGRLPGQAEPTRIAITPFADIPGFAPPTAIPGEAPAATPGS